MKKKKKKKNIKGKLEHGHLNKIQINFNILCNLHINCNSHKLVSSFYEENNFIPCLTEQLLKVLKLWCEWGITLQ